MNILKRNWNCTRSLSKYSGKPPYIVIHHAAAQSMNAGDINRVHKARGYSCIGYHYYVEKDGDIYRGRPENTRGAHTLGWNHCIGVCFEGAYHKEKNMPDKQLYSGQELLQYLTKKYPKAKVRGHGSMSGNATACPGKYMPMKELQQSPIPPAVPGKSINVPVMDVPTKDKPKWWGKMMRWVKANRG